MGNTMSGIMGGIGKFGDVAQKAIKADNVKSVKLKLKVKKDPKAAQQKNG